MKQCHKCGSANPAAKKFCGDRGEPLNVVCNKCKTLNEPGHKFCKECGEKLAKQPAKPTKEISTPGDLSSTVASAKEPAKPIAFFPLLAIVVVLIVVTGYVTFELLTLPGTNPILQPLTYCGDGVCGDSEGCTSCATDCNCQIGYECTADHCIKIPYCGDGICSETCSSCPQDCGVCLVSDAGCSSDSDCSHGYCIYGVCRATAPYCGDGYCDADETRLLCRQDCGKPLTGNSTCIQNGDCESNYCANGTCATSSSYSMPSGYSVSWSPLTGEGFWTLFPSGSSNSSTSGVYAPGGLYGWTIKFVNGASVRYDYWAEYAAEHCLENTASMSPQDIRAAAEDPKLNCERFNVPEVAPEIPKQECNDTYSWCPAKGKCIRLWEEPCYEVERPW